VGQGQAAVVARHDRLGEEEAGEDDQLTCGGGSGPATAALAASTAQRLGTAVNAVRMSPLLYSDVNTSTLRTVTGRTVYSA
jgi:hypothetical protein